MPPGSDNTRQNLLTRISALFPAINNDSSERPILAGSNVSDRRILFSTEDGRSGTV